jgi:pimeloyl-ACP methyl ester carboxylesterase
MGRAVVVGHSGSCLVARRIALDHPDRVAGLILEASPTTLRQDPKLVGFVDSVVAKLEDPISRDFARSFVADTSAAGLQADLLVEEVLKARPRAYPTLGRPGAVQHRPGALRGILTVPADAERKMGRQRAQPG